MAKARIQEIMTGAYDQDRLASFYCDVFGMKIVWRRRPAPDGSRRGLFLSDGYVCLCIQQAGDRGGQARPEGLQGIGLVVDELEDVDRLAVPYGAPDRPTRRLHPDGEGFIDAEVLDPVGTLVNLTTRGFGVEPLQDVAHMPPAVHPGTLPDVGTGIRCVRLEGADPAALCRFYRNVFGFDEVDGKTSETTPTSECLLTDGRTNLSFGAPSPDPKGQTLGRMAGFGFVVEDVPETLRRATVAGAAATPPSERGRMPAANAHIVDPVGVRIDIIDRGPLG